MGLLISIGDRAMVKLDNRRTIKAPPAGGGRPQIWQAVSENGRWLFDRVEVPSTPWRTEYLPTGQDQFFTTLADARRWAVDEPTALRFLRDRAAAVVAAGGRSETIVRQAAPSGMLVRVAEDPGLILARFLVADRALAMLDGRLVDGPADGRCTCRGMACSGFVAEIIAPSEPGGEQARRWVTADVCGRCLTRDLDARRRCGLATPHRACPEADPLLCTHTRCHGVATPDPGPCLTGSDACCGCCAAL